MIWNILQFRSHLTISVTLTLHKSEVYKTIATCILTYERTYKFRYIVFAFISVRVFFHSGIFIGL